MKRNLLLLFILVASTVSAQKLDSSYGDYGRQIAFMEETEIGVKSSFLLSNQELIVSGTQYFSDGSDPKTYMKAFTPDGQPDNNFGVNGIISLPGLNGGYSAVQSTQKIILVTWYSFGGFFQQLQVNRYTVQGKPDSSFGTNGQRQYNLGHGLYQVPTCVSIDKNDNIYIGGFFDYSYPNNRIQIVKLNSDGIIDSTFKVIGPRNQTCNSLTILRDNTLLAGFYNDTSGGRFTAKLIKFNKRGKVVTDFADNGLLVLNNIVIGSASQDVFTQESLNGSFIVLYRNKDDILFRKFNADGSPDNSFGKNSYASTQGNYSSTFAIDFSENILQPLHPFTIKRYTPNGSIDSSFGTNSLVRTDFTDLFGSYDEGTYYRVIPTQNGFYATGSWTDADDLIGSLAVSKYITNNDAIALTNNAQSIKIAVNKIAIAPNPVHDVLNINGLPAQSHIAIIDAQGSIVKVISGNENISKINVNDLSNGVYYIVVKETNQKEKFIKQ